ncbi:TPA: hypothetical protein ACK3JH_000442 [Mannheimia haemolytica]
MILQNHIRTISPARLKPYEKLCEKLIENHTFSPSELSQVAICVYTALQHRSCIFYSLIQEIEICVRNEMSLILKNTLSNKDLLSHFCYLAFSPQSELPIRSKRQLETTILDFIDPARKNKNFKNDMIALAELQKKGIDENDIISSVTFGFWVHLLNPDTKVNQKYLHWSNIFHNKIFNGVLSNNALFYKLRDILAFRNRLYHQDVVWKNKNVSTPEKALRRLANRYEEYAFFLNTINPIRYSFRNSSYLQEWQHQMNFDIRIFNAELAKQYNDGFTPPA